MEIFKGGVETNQFIILADCVWRPEMAMSGNDEKEEELLAGDASCIVCGRAPFPFIQQEQWKQESQSHQNGVCRTWNNYILLEHQSISRNHCVIQFGMGKEGFVQLYLYDLGSTHGSMSSLSLSLSLSVPLEEFGHGLCTCDVSSLGTSLSSCTTYEVLT